jgi:hypothetical protein
MAEHQAYTTPGLNAQAAELERLTEGAKTHEPDSFDELFENPQPGDDAWTEREHGLDEMEGTLRAQRQAVSGGYEHDTAYGRPMFGRLPVRVFRDSAGEISYHLPGGNA